MLAHPDNLGVPEKSALPLMKKKEVPYWQPDPLFHFFWVVQAQRIEPVAAM
jgi:hypothetical protein